MKLPFFLNRIAAFLLFLCMLFSSCKKKERPVTPEEAKEFSKKLEQSVSKRETEFFDEAIDKKELIKRAHIPSDRNASGFKRGMTSAMKIGTNMKRELTAKAVYTLVKQYTKDNTSHILFRLYDNGSLNYHDMELIHSGKEVKIADIFIYTTGENLSETLHGIFLQMTDVIDKSSVLNESDEWLKKMPEMKNLMSKNKGAEALEIYNKIPEKIRKGRAFQIIHVLICSNLDFDIYSAAIDEYKSLYPNEPNMHLLLLDGYVLHEEFGKALNAVNELDKMIDKDPFLDYYRYLCYNLLKENQNGRRSLEQLMKNFPYFEDGMLELITTYLKDKDYAAAKPWVDKFKSKSSFTQSGLNIVLTNYPGYDQ